MGTPLSGFESLSGTEWQDLCLRVLHEHHGGGELIEVPDDDRGDAGLEAFSLDGCVYQCYAPEGEPLTMDRRYAKQRKKMTDDVGKFIDNRAKISDLLPPEFKVFKWILLLPYINTKRIHEHAKIQTTRVRNACLPYGGPGIVVLALTLRAYEAAKQAVIARQLNILRLPPVPGLDFSGVEDPQIDVMRQKLAKTPWLQTLESRNAWVDRLLENYVAGRAHRDWLRDQYSELGDQLEEHIDDLQARLAMQYPLSQPDPQRLFAAILQDTEQTVTSVLNVGASQSRVIAEGQVADWLMRCPLDFT